MISNVFSMNWVLYSQKTKNKEKANIQKADCKTGFRKHPGLALAAAVFFGPVISIAAVAALTVSLIFPFACLFGWL